jgi:hypothetical protein
VTTRDGWGEWVWLEKEGLVVGFGGGSGLGEGEGEVGVCEEWMVGVVDVVVEECEGFENLGGSSSSRR